MSCLLLLLERLILVTFPLFFQLTLVFFLEAALVLSQLFVALVKLISQTIWSFILRSLWPLVVLLILHLD